MAIDSQSSSSSSPSFQSSSSTSSSTGSSSGAGQSASFGSDDTMVNQSQKLAPSTGHSSTHASGHASGTAESAIDLLRGSVVGVLESVVREYEPQIAQFTTNLAHQAVDRGVTFAHTTVQRAQKQSWMRLGLAAALGVGIVAILGYEASEAAQASDGARNRSSVH